jgi:DNA-binding NarL/FixJ family response regulator
VRIEILLGAMPRMLHDVVGAILGAEQDMRVVDEDVEHDVLIEHVDRGRPDVVVLAVPAGSPPTVCGELLSRFPRLTVVALEDRGQRGSVYALQPMRVRLEELSGSELVGAIRRAAIPVPFLSSIYDVGPPTMDAAASGDRTQQRLNAEPERSRP